MKMKFADFKKIFAFLLIVLILLENPIIARRHLTKSKLKTKRLEPVEYHYIGVIGVGLFCNKYFSRWSSGSSDDKCEDPEKYQPKLDALNNNIVEKSKILVKIIETRSEFNNLRGFVLEHISQFIGVIPAKYFATHEEFILNYINCYIDEKVKDP